MNLLVRIAQSVCAGFFCSLMVGLVCGLIGMREHVLMLWTSYILTFFIAGIVAGRKTNKRFLAAAFTWMALIIINHGVVVLAFGTQLTDNVFSWLIQAIIGFIIVMLGAFITSYRLLNRSLKKRSERQGNMLLQK